MTDHDRSRFAVRVFGVPAPAGSKTVVPTPAGPRVVDGGSKAARQARTTWRGDVVDAARRALPDSWQPLDGPLALELVLIVPRPRSLPAHRRDGSEPRPTTRPDVTKLLRATEDALTAAGVWHDDAQVVTVTASKRYATATLPAGCLLEVSRLGDTSDTHPVWSELDRALLEEDR